MQELFVGKQLGGSHFRSLVILTIFLGFLSFYYAQEGPPHLAGWFRKGTLCTLVLSVAVWLHVKMNWRKLTILPDGFALKDRQGLRKVKDDEVVDFATASATGFREGLPASVVKQSSYWIGSGGRIDRIDFDLEFPIGETDPTKELEDRLTERLSGLWEASLLKGSVLQGGGWKLETDALTAPGPEGPLRLLLEKITFLARSDRSLCIWRGNEESPVFRIPEGSMNCRILDFLLRKRLGKKIFQPPPTSGNLGRVLFERKDAPGSFRNWFLGTAFFLFLGFLALANGELFGALFVSPGVMVMALMALRSTRIRFRGHQLGVSQRGLSSEDSLGFAEICSFTYNYTRLFVNFRYRDSTLKMWIVPFPGLYKPTIYYRATLEGEDEELKSLRDRLSRVLAFRMGKQLETGEPVVWTRRLKFLPDRKLEFRPSTLFGGAGEAKVFPLDRISSEFEVEEGTLKIWLRGECHPVIEDDASGENFWPGLQLLSNLLSSPPETES